MHDTVNITVVGGDAQGEGGSPEMGAVDEFGVAHYFVVKERDFLVVRYEVVSDGVLECESAVSLIRGFMEKCCFSETREREHGLQLY